MKVVIGGVSGSGKTTIGQYLANLLEADFLDADSYHPPENIQKMSEGIPLNDQDRAGWIDALGKELSRHRRVVLACSALKKAYRDRLKQFEPSTQFAILVLDKGQLQERIQGRSHTGHFMPATLLDSQLATLEMSTDVVQILNTKPPQEIACQIATALNLTVK